jgi:hypothetical protein
MDQILADDGNFCSIASNNDPPQDLVHDKPTEALPPPRWRPGPKPKEV